VGFASKKRLGPNIGDLESSRLKGNEKSSGGGLSEGS